MNSEVVVFFTDGLRASAAARIEHALTSIRGVRSVSVNLVTDKVRVTYDPAAATLRRLIEVVRSTGVDVLAAHAIIDVDHIGCPSCAARIEQALRAVSGVLHASVDLPTRRAIVSYLPGYLTHRDLAHAITEAGYQPAGEAAAVQSARRETVGTAGH